MLGLYYKSDELQTTLQMTRLELLAAGIEPNPGPACIHCKLDFKITHKTDIICANCWRGDNLWAIQMGRIMSVDDISRVIHRCYRFLQCRTCCRLFTSTVKILGVQAVTDKLEVINSVMCFDCSRHCMLSSNPPLPQRIMDLNKEYLSIDSKGDFAPSLISSHHPIFQCIVARSLSLFLVNTVFDNFWLVLLASNVMILHGDLYMTFKGCMIIIDSLGDIYYAKMDWNFLQMQVLGDCDKVLDLRQYISFPERIETFSSYIAFINNFYDSKVDFRIPEKDKHVPEQII